MAGRQRAGQHHAAAGDVAGVHLGGGGLLDAVAEHGRDQADAAHHGGKFVGLGRSAVVGAGQVVVQGQVLFDHRRAQGHRGQRRFRTLAVVRIAGGETRGLGDGQDGLEVQGLGRRRVGRGAVEQGQVLGARLAEAAGAALVGDPADGALELGERGHAARQEQRQAGGGGAFQQRLVGHLARGQLDALDPQAHQHRHRLLRKGSREELDADLLRVRGNLAVFVLVQLELPDHVELVGVAGVGALVVGGGGVGRDHVAGAEGLELHRVGAGPVRGLHQLQGQVEAAVVVDAGLGDDKDMGSDHADSLECVAPRRRYSHSAISKSRRSSMSSERSRGITLGRIAMDQKPCAIARGRAARCQT